MAGAGGDLVPARRAPASSRRKALKWDVEYARYFAKPRRGPSTPPPPGLRYISRGKLRHQGTWLPASTPASLCISQPSLPSAVPVLTVSIGGVAFEEHFVSILNFSWPQVTCVTQCPIRGSRVVFMSFCDKFKQIQKFAVLFPQLTDAESFLNCVKECSVETMDIIPFGSDYMCENSSTSEYIASNGLQHRPNDASSYEEPASDQVIEAPALSYHEGLHQPIVEPLLTGNIDNIYSGFPPSFSQMLTNCSTENEKDAVGSNPVTATSHIPQEVYALDKSHDVVSTKTTADKGKDAAEGIDASKVTTALMARINASTETTADKGKDAAEGFDASKVTSDLMARIKTYMAEDSFHDMLFKLEKVIDELGGGMSL